MLKHVVSLLILVSVSFAQPTNFQHIVLIIQENRTPDNLFQGLCAAPYGSPTTCSTTPGSGQYNIQTSNWKDKAAPGGVIQPVAIALNAAYGPDHSHKSWLTSCDYNANKVCQMDGAATIQCPNCPANTPYTYADYSTGTLNPYLNFATQYGWANYMFQTNQGPSFPAHQYLLGGTSAATTNDDAIGTYATDNANIPGCAAPSTAYVLTYNVNGKGPNIYPCFEHATLTDLLNQQGVSWRYYTYGQNNIWSAPDAINHMCGSTGPGGTCVGSDWVNNVDLHQVHVLNDIAACNLRALSWVIPSGQASDHPVQTNGSGPSWVASIVNAIGSSTCKNPDGSSYWNSTAIIVTWDDWGGFYDHEPPTILPMPYGDYQYGFRVPMIFISAYTQAGYINNERHDFGSILRFIENNWGITEGALDFADARSTTDLSAFYSFNLAPKQYKKTAAKFNAKHFLRDKSTPTDPDDD